MTKFLSCLILSCAFALHAEEVKPPPKPAAEPAPVEELPAKPKTNDDRPWFTALSMEVPSLGFTFRDRKSDSGGATPDPDQEVVYEPNASSNLGVKAGYGAYRLRVTVPIEPDEEDKRLKGETKHTDLMFGYSWKKFGFDTFFQSYKGFFVASGDQAGTIRPDVKSQFYGANFYYAFDSERYPLESMTNLDWEGRDSNWGFLGIASLSHFEFDGDTPLLTKTGLKSVDFYAATVGAGIGGFKTGENYLANANMSLGIGPEKQNVEYVPATGTATTDDKLGFTFQYTVNGAVAYRKNAWMGGLNFKFNLIMTYLGDTELTSNGTSGEFFVAYKF